MTEKNQSHENKIINRAMYGFIFMSGDIKLNC